MSLKLNMEGYHNWFVEYLAAAGQDLPLKRTQYQSKIDICWHTEAKVPKIPVLALLWKNNVYQWRYILSSSLCVRSQLLYTLWLHATASTE